MDTKTAGTGPQMLKLTRKALSTLDVHALKALLRNRLTMDSSLELARALHRQGATAAAAKALRAHPLDDYSPAHWPFIGAVTTVRGSDAATDALLVRYFREAPIQPLSEANARNLVRWVVRSGHPRARKLRWLWSIASFRMTARWLLGAGRRRLLKQSQPPKNSDHPEDGSKKKPIQTSGQDSTVSAAALAAMSDDQLIKLADASPDTETLIEIAKQLLERNLSEVSSRLLRVKPLEQYGRKHWPAIGFLLSKAGPAPDADHLLQSYWKTFEHENLNTKPSKYLGEWISMSGLPASEKVRIYASLQRQVPNGDHGKLSWRLQSLKLSMDSLQQLSRKDFDTLTATHLLPRDRFKVASFLYRMGHQKTARAVITVVPLTSYPKELLPRVSQMLVGTSSGVDMDSTLSEFIDDLKPSATSVQLATGALNWVQRSSLGQQERDQLISRLEKITFPDREDSERWKASLLKSKYEQRRAENILVDPLDYVPHDVFSSDTAKHYIYFISQLRLNGAVEKSLELLDALHRPGSQEDLVYWVQMIRNFPAKVDIREVPHPDTLQGRVDLLGVLAPIAALSADHVALVEKLKSALVIDFVRATLIEQNTILKNLMWQNLLDCARLAISSVDHVSDLLLPAKIISGWDAFENGDYDAAHNLFTSVIEEKPSDSLAIAGLRLTSLRTGEGFGAMIKHNKNIEGPVIPDRKLFKDEIWYHRSRGELLQSALSHLKEPHWSLLARVLGDRFLVDQCLESLNSDAKVFIIGSSGVGDEIRAARLYGRITKKFADVTATCDPRLVGLLSRSFPSLKLVPCWRNRPGLVDRLEKMGDRIRGWNGLLHQILNDRAEKHLLDADYVICLGYLRYLDALDAAEEKERTGRYLVPPVQPMTNSSPPPDNRPFRVGLLWRSHLLIKERRHLYLPVESFSSLLGVPRVEFHSIQHEMNADEIDFCLKHGIVRRDDIDFFNDFDAMSEYLSSLDLVIGISSVPAELAAALGVPVWFLGFSPENYFLRTNGGQTEVDQLTLNARVITSTDIDFTEPPDVCISRTIEEVRLRLHATLKEREF